MAVSALAAATVSQMLHLWRPFGDDAVIAWRSYDVFSRHLPLVGQFSQAFTQAHPPYDLGPGEDWLLAVPVRLDPVHGVLWGAALLCAVALVAGVEASWSVARWPGALIFAGGAATLALTYQAVVLDPIWNPYFGAVLLLASFPIAWAVASGDLRWLVALAAVASLAVQSHLVYVVPGLLLAAAAVLLGVARSRRDSVRPLARWLVAASLVLLVLWIPPIVQQFTGHPGNLSVLVQARHQQRSGYGLALRALGAFTRPFPAWWHSVVPPGPAGPSLSHFYTVVLSGSPAGGVVVVALLLAVVLVCLLTRRWILGAAAAVSWCVSVGTVWSLAQLPQSQLSRLSYLDVVLWPVGMAAWATLSGALGCLLWATARRFGRSARQRPARAPLPSLAVVGLGGLLALGGLATASAATAPGSNPYRSESLELTAELTPLALQLAPTDRPFTMSFRGVLPQAIYPPSLVEAIAYRLHVAHLDPRFEANWQQIGPWVRPGSNADRMLLIVQADGAVSVRLCAPHGVACRTAVGPRLRVRGAAP